MSDITLNQAVEYLFNDVGGFLQKTLPVKVKVIGTLYPRIIEDEIGALYEYLVNHNSKDQS